MPIYRLIDIPVFPDPNEADKTGLLAIGGDLSSDRLLEAYRNGIFPWYSQNEPIMWWSPDPRMILIPEEFKRTRNLRKLVFGSKFQVTIDKAFREVIARCANVPRRGQDSTWITADMINAFTKLHEIGYAHSIEVWQNDMLVGGLYGLSLGRCFFGESMFHNITDASKVALWHLVDLCISLNIGVIDVQQETDHMRSMGAKPIIRKDFITLLSTLVRYDDIIGDWAEIEYGLKDQFLPNRNE